jgi:hypothetical protein
MAIVVDQKGNLKEIDHVDVVDYGKKKCVWKVNGKTIELYGRSKPSKSRKIVQYEFPPPCDQKILYGQCLLTVNNETLTITEWDKIYEELMGGFEDIHTESDVSEDEDTGLRKTKEGYVEDGFVVSDRRKLI